MISLSAQTQQTPAAKPKYVIIADGEIVSKEQIETYQKQGYVKQMRKGVSEKERSELAAKFGDVIGDKEFIMVFTLLTEEERKQKEKTVKPGGPVIRDSMGNSRSVFYQTNEPAKNFTVSLSDGTTISLASLKGKVVLLNFWATWCAPCLEEFYEVPSKIIEPFKKDAFVFLPVAKGETLTKAMTKMDRLKKDSIQFVVGADPDETIANLYEANTIPKNLLIDQDGIIRFISVGNGEANLDRLAAEIKKMLKK
jgi:peroxiredoxin